MRVEEADRLLRRISGKDNCFAAAVIDKKLETRPGRSHLALVSPMDRATWAPCCAPPWAWGSWTRPGAPRADPFEPQAVRAGTGAVLSMNVYGTRFDAYRTRIRHRVCLHAGGRAALVRRRGIRAPFCLVFGNEGSGLPPEFARFGAVKIEQTDRVDSLNLAAAAAIGLYAFRQI